MSRLLIEMNEHIDDPVHIDVEQPDRVAVHPDDELLTFTYRNGAVWTVRLGEIGLDFGPAAEWYDETGGLTFPMHGAYVLLNATTVPRLAGMRAWILEHALGRAEPPTMAELVGAFVGFT